MDKYYVVEVMGDLDDDWCSFPTLSQALNHVKVTYSGDKQPSEDYDGNPTEAYPTPDPEDDRILVWEVVDGHSKVVWQFSGWHWNHIYVNIDGSFVEQGTLPGHPDTLYNLAMKDYWWTITNSQ